MENDNNKIIKIENKLENIKSICERNNEWLKEDVENTKQLLKDHCGKINKNEKDMIKVQTEIKPMVNFFNNLGKFLIGFMITVGTLITGAIYFFIDRK